MGGGHKKKLNDVIRESEKIIYIIGPEGGFDSEEVEKAKGHGFIPINLGQRILKAETAAITVLAILQHEVGNL